MLHMEASPLLNAQYGFVDEGEVPKNLRLLVGRVILFTLSVIIILASLFFFGWATEKLYIGNVLDLETPIMLPSLAAGISGIEISLAARRTLPTMTCVLANLWYMLGMGAMLFAYGTVGLHDLQDRNMWLVPIGWAFFLSLLAIASSFVTNVAAQDNTRSLYGSNLSDYKLKKVTFVRWPALGLFIACVLQCLLFWYNYVMAVSNTMHEFTTVGVDIGLMSFPLAFISSVLGMFFAIRPPTLSIYLVNLAVCTLAFVGVVMGYVYGFAKTHGILPVKTLVNWTSVSICWLFLFVATFVFSYLHYKKNKHCGI